MLIIGLVGPPASGKHLIADILRTQHSFVTIDYKDFKEKKDAAAEECLSNVKETWPKNVVIIGIDSFESMAKMRNNSQFFSIAIEGPNEDFIRFDDYLQFGVKTDGERVEQIIETLHFNDEEISSLNQCMDACDLRLVNDTNDRTNLEKRLAELLSANPEDQQLTTTKLLCPNWDQYFSILAWITASHGNCLRHRIGCIIADNDQRIIATGYNGTPGNIKACNEGGCKRCWDVLIEHGERLDECICIHGEESALLEAGRRQCRNATLYVTHNPCRQCSKKIAQSGIKRVVYTREYSSSLDDVKEFFELAQIELIQLKMVSIPLLKLNR